MLGDRLSYIGLSDIGRYLDCPRAAIFSKLNAHNHTLADQITLQRGHWFENGVGDVFAAMGMRQLPQLEVDCHSEAFPVKAHIDFTLVWDKPAFAVRVLEVKSMAQLPDIPYSAHEAQVTGQTTLLKEYWQHPVFSLRDSKGYVLDSHLTFPEICTRHLGICLPENPEKISIEGWLLCLSMKDASAYGPYSYDKDFLQKVMQNADLFWTQLQGIQNGSLSWEALPYAQGYHALCSCCKANADCPKFRTGSFQPQWEPQITRLEELKQDRSRLEAEIREIENSLKNAHQLSDCFDWIDTGAHRFRLSSVKGRRSLDRELLRSQLSDLFSGIGIENTDVDSFIASCEKESAPSSRLTVTAIN